MSRLESDNLPRYSTVEESNIEAKAIKLVAMPLHMRQEAVSDFDREFRITDIRDRDSRQDVHLQSSELAEFITNANLLLKEKEYKLAEEFYQSVLKLDAQNELALRGAAECANALGDMERAVEILKGLTAKNKSAANCKLLADQLYEMNYNHDAIEAYLNALSFGQFDGEELFTIYKNLGNIFLKTGDAEAAEEYYNKAYTLQPDSDTLLVNFGSLALYRGAYETALARFREAVSLNDRNDKAWAGLGMIHREYGDAELAWANLEKALDINPQNLAALKLLVEWAMKDNELDKANLRLFQYLEIEPKDAQMRMWFAKFLYFSGQLIEAQTEIEKAMQFDPFLPGALEVREVIRDEMRSKQQNYGQGARK